MTLLYAVQWPLAADADLVPKWTHSVLSENPCRTEWAAQASASFLAFELGQSTFHAAGDVTPQTCKRRGALQVSFATEVQVLIGLENSLSCCSMHVLPEVLQSPSKPWALRPPDYQPSASPKFIPLEGEGPIWESVVYHFVQIPELSHPCWISGLHPLESSEGEECCEALHQHEPCYRFGSRPVCPALSCPVDFGDPLSSTAVLISSLQCVDCPSCPSHPQSLPFPTVSCEVCPESASVLEKSFEEVAEESDEPVISPVVAHGSPSPFAQASSPCCLQSVVFSHQHRPFGEVDFEDFAWSESSIFSIGPEVQTGFLVDMGGPSAPNLPAHCSAQDIVAQEQASSGDPLSTQAVLISEVGLDVNDFTGPAQVSGIQSPLAELIVDSPCSTSRSCTPAVFSDSAVQVIPDSGDEHDGQQEISHQIAAEHKSIVQHKVSDGDAGQRAQYTNAPVVTPVGFPFEFELPAFVREMIIHLPAGFTDRPRPANDGPLVRIWYIHLDFQARSFHERQLQLTGPPHFWRAQIIAVWFDVLAPNQDVAIDLVLPIPPRKWFERSLVFDVILSQSTFARRKPALITVLPNPVARSLQLYSGAVALDAQITGNQAIQGIAVEQVCADRFCQVTFGHQVIANEGPAAHQVSAGNGFVVHIGRKRSQAAGSADDVATSMYLPMDVNDSQHIDSEPALGSSGPGDSGSPSQHSQRQNDQPSMRAVLYALDKPAKHAMVRPHLPQCLLHEVANVYGVQPSQIVALHFLQVTPVGEPPLSVHIIVQFLGDVVPGSTDQLLLLDVAFHCHGFNVQPCVQTPVDRRVVLLPQTLIRARLSDAAFVGTYCELHGHRCLVSFNRQPWKQQDVMISGLLSGGYLRIELPPPHALDAHTCHVAELVEDLGLDETPHFADHYPDLPETSVTRERSRVIEKTSARHDSPPSVLPEQQWRGLAHEAYHLGPHHQQDVLSWQTDVHTIAPHLLPRLQNVQAFELEFATIFRDYAQTEREAEGQVAYIATWYVHHDHHPVCLKGRLIRVNANRQSWFSELCRPGFFRFVDLRPLQSEL